MNTLKFGLAVIGAISLLGCSSNPIRTKWTDVGLRVLIDPESVSVDDYVSIQTALVKEGRFMVIDRNLAFKAIKAEQDRIHRNEVDRFDDREKWARYGRIFSVGSIIVGHSQCVRTQTFFSLSKYVNQCKQYLSIVSSSTGQIVAAVDNYIEVPARADNFGSESFSVPTDWTEAVGKLVSAYPEKFSAEYYSPGVVKYQDESKEAAQRQRELASPKQDENK